MHTVDEDSQIKNRRHADSAPVLVTDDDSFSETVLNDAEHGSEIEQTPAGAQFRTEWNPLILKRSVLCGFIVFFGCSLAALEALNQVSNTKKGLAKQDDRHHYFWTYGPSSGKFLGKHELHSR